ncbi:MAG TPA: 4a-hydroxytetrahydrobiopterin dehydratase [Gaiellaceae bacterium]|nr:4a-hydroxytetrahydrobiopterin dehydratase [Gaiellaceae bacterium]
MTVGRNAASIPFASVIVPTRGRPGKLLRALSSIQAQDERDWEAIVVDDGDGEGLAAVRTLADPRVHALGGTGQGPAEARAAGIARAAGRLVCWLDDDDWWEDPHHLSALCAALGRAGERRFLFRGGWLVHEHDGTREVFDHPATSESLRVNNTILTSSIAYPLAARAELGPLDPAVGGYCDWDFMLRLCDAGFELVQVAGLGVCYEVGAPSLSKAYDAPARRAQFERFRAKHGLEIELSNHERIHKMLSEMPVPDGWAEVDGALERTFRLESFPAAIAFVTRVAGLAEAENHHPDIAISYRDVTLRWRTHSAEAITDRDRELASASAALA